MTQYNNYSEVFNSLSAFNSALNERTINVAFSSHQSSVTGTAKFTTTENYQEASDLMLSGDIANLDKLVTVDGVDLSHIHGTKKVNRQQKSVAGGFPLVPVYLTGVPKNMLASKKITTKTKVISIVYNLSVCGNISSKDIVAAGAKVASIIKYLEAKGIRCNLYVADVAKSVYSDMQVISFAVKIKDAGAPLNLLNIAYPLINPSMLRRHVFRFIETCPAAVSGGIARGYGVPGELNKHSDVCEKIGNNVTVINCSQILKSDVSEIANNIIKSITI